MKNELLLMLLFVLIGIAGGNVTVVAQPLEPTGQGGNEVNSVLTADINLCHSDYPDLMIGMESRPFCDIFDGGNHTVTYNYEMSQKNGVASSPLLRTPQFAIFALKVIHT